MIQQAPPSRNRVFAATSTPASWLISCLALAAMVSTALAQAPTITSANNTTFTAGAPNTFTVTTSGFLAPPTITETGALPGGVSFTDNGNGTATLAGTPDALTGGTYSFTITAANGVGSNATQTFTLTVDQAPAITSISSTTFTVGTAGTFTVTSTGFPIAGLSES